MPGECHPGRQGWGGRAGRRWQSRGSPLLECLPRATCRVLAMRWGEVGGVNKALPLVAALVLWSVGRWGGSFRAEQRCLVVCKYRFLVILHIDIELFL